MSVLHLPHAVFLPCCPHLGEHKMVPRIHPTCLIHMDKSCISSREELPCTTPSPSSYSETGKPRLTFWVDKAKEVWIRLMSSLLKMDVSVFLIGSIVAEFQLNLQKKVVCRKLLCSQARNYSWRELFSYPYFRPTSLKIFKFLISEKLWNPIDFIITHKKIMWSFSSGTTGRGKQTELIFLTWNTTQMIVFQTGRLW